MVFFTMRTTIDAAGRLVIPKAARDALALEPRAELEVRVVDGHIEIEVPPTAMRLEETDHGVVAVTDREMPLLTVQMVRDTLDQVRR
jgi:AbrB family looped-hinge helix DNA binding protein